MTATQKPNGRLTFRRVPSEEERLADFLEHFEPAVSGQDGHGQLFAFVRALVFEFQCALPSAWKLVRQYNLRCQPRWSKAELVHKVCDAYKSVGVHYSEANLMASLPFSADDTEVGDSDFIAPAASRKPIPRAKPSHAGFGPGTEEQLQRLANLRGISVAGLHWAQARGVLVFGLFAGHQVFGITDQSGVLLEVRRLDGKPFPAVGHLAERKSHAVRGSSKRHPVGIFEAQDYSNIIVTEGIPDFLAAHDLILRAQADTANLTTASCAPVALLSANVAIDDTALPIFKGKYVRIFYHNDASGAGWEGARRWQREVVKVGAHCCDFFHFKDITGVAVKDLNDYVRAVAAGEISGGLNILPDFQL